MPLQFSSSIHTSALLKLLLKITTSVKQSIISVIYNYPNQITGRRREPHYTIGKTIRKTKKKTHTQTNSIFPMARMQIRPPLESEPIGVPLYTLSKLQIRQNGNPARCECEVRREVGTTIEHKTPVVYTYTPTCICVSNARFPLRIVCIPRKKMEKQAKKNRSERGVHVYMYIYTHEKGLANA